MIQRGWCQPKGTNSYRHIYIYRLCRVSVYKIAIHTRITLLYHDLLRSWGNRWCHS